MSMHQLKAGLPVMTAPEIGSLQGTGLATESLQNRQSCAPGVVTGFHPEHRGDVWLVDHGDGRIAAYHFEELKIPKGSLLPDWARSE